MIAAQHILDGSSLNDVAGIVDKDVTTICKWSKMPAFIHYVAQGRAVKLLETGSRLSKASFIAACVLQDIATDEDVKPETRSRAASEILSLTLKYAESVDLANRIQAIEDTLKTNLGDSDDD